MLEEAATMKDLHQGEEAEEENRFDGLDRPAGMPVSKVPSQGGVGGSPETAVLRDAAQAAFARESENGSDED